MYEYSYVTSKSPCRRVILAAFNGMLVHLLLQRPSKTGRFGTDRDTFRRLAIRRVDKPTPFSQEFLVVG